MTATTLTMAGHMAHAGDARAAVAGARAAHVGVYGLHLSPWTQGVFAEPTTKFVIDDKNRPTRHLSELSP